jgi:hypothetical protein
VDGEHKHPLGITVPEGKTHESPQFDHLSCVKIAMARYHQRYYFHILSDI